MAIVDHFRTRLGAGKSRMLEIASVLLMCLACELLIWVLFLALKEIQAQFLAPIGGMILVFGVMAILTEFFPKTEDWYFTHVKSKTDFINQHLGIGFPVPLAMINETNLLKASEISKVIAAFVMTNLFCWPFVMASATGLVYLFHLDLRRSSYKNHQNKAQQYNGQADESFFNEGASCTSLVLPPALVPRVLNVSLMPRFSLGLSSLSTISEMPAEPLGTYYPGTQATLPKTTSELTLGSNTSSSFCNSTLDLELDTIATDKNPNVQLTIVELPTTTPTWLCMLTEYYAIPLALATLLTIGVPLAVLCGEDRVLDFCVLWLLWILFVKLQRAGRASTYTLQLPLGRPIPTKTLLTVLLNPVMWTSLGLVAVLLAKTALRPGILHTTTLAHFSSGTSLANLLTHHATGGAWLLPVGRANDFGAGDVALAFLDCGIVVWGFKLYECRHQLCSRAGMAAVMSAICAAAVNLVVSLALARFGAQLAPAEALAFAARSTTLALSRPGMETLGGNQEVNAAIVVCNGIIGQSLYPWVADWINKGCVSNEKQQQGKMVVSGGDVEQFGAAIGATTTITAAVAAPPPRKCRDRKTSVATGAGVTFGVNSAAMGVSLLYEDQSEAAPYSAVAMTVFGVLTVVFTCIGPFADLLKKFAA